MAILIIYHKNREVILHLRYTKIKIKTTDIIQTFQCNRSTTFFSYAFDFEEEKSRLYNDIQRFWSKKRSTNENALAVF